MKQLLVAFLLAYSVRAYAMKQGPSNFVPISLEEEGQAEQPQRQDNSSQSCCSKVDAFLFRKQRIIRKILALVAVGVSVIVIALPSYLIGNYFGYEEGQKDPCQVCDCT